MANEDIIYALTIPVIKELFVDFVDHNIISTIKDVDNLGAVKINDSFIYLKVCDKDHDLTQEFNKLQPYLSNVQWDHVLRIISLMVFMVRSIYKNLCDEYNINSTLLVDTNNTTLYTANTYKRIGIFIEKEEKIENL
jgi:hypothetical protein